MALIKTLQTQVAPQIFTPRAVYDGRKNMFAIRELPFGGSSSQEVLSPYLLLVEIVRFYFLQFDVSFSERAETGSKGPKVFKIKLTKVAEINPEYVCFDLHGVRPSPLSTQSPTALYRGQSVP